MLSSSSSEWVRLPGENRLSLRLSHPEVLSFLAQGCLHSSRLHTGSASVLISHPLSDFLTLSQASVDLPTHHWLSTAWSWVILKLISSAVCPRLIPFLQNATHLWSWCMAKSFRGKTEQPFFSPLYFSFLCFCFAICFYASKTSNQTQKEQFDMFTGKKDACPKLLNDDNDFYQWLFCFIIIKNKIINNGLKVNVMCCTWITAFFFN